VSRRDAILDSFKQLLSTITTANGYNCDVAKVERKMLYWDAEESFPVLMVLGGNEEFEDTLGSVVYSTLHIRIRGYSQDSTDPETALCNIIADVIKAIDSQDNPYRNETTFIRLETDEGWFNFQEQGFGYFDLEITVLYSYEKGNP